MDAFSSPSFDLFANPFRIFLIDPAATDAVVNDAFNRAKMNGTWSDILGEARSAIGEPSKRLFHELSYPLDSPREDIDALYAALSSQFSASDLLEFSERLAPLSRANFIAHLTARRPASGARLTAFVQSHALIDSTHIYEILKTKRGIAGYPAPSLVNVDLGLADQLDQHIEATMGRYKTVQEMTKPVLACTEQIFAHGEGHRVEVLGKLLAVYRRYIGPPQAMAAANIGSLCEALRDHPTNITLLDHLMKALRAWVMLCRPLILLDTYHGRIGAEFEALFQQVRDLVALLTIQQTNDIALRIARFAHQLFSTDIFSAQPPIVEQLQEDIRIIESRLVELKIAPLRQLIADLERDPAPLVAALEQHGFGQTAAEPAKALWTAFVQALDATEDTEAVEPWQLTRNLAMRLNHKAKAPRATSALLAGTGQSRRSRSRPT